MSLAEQTSAEDRFPAADGVASAMVGLDPRLGSIITL